MRTHRALTPKPLRRLFKSWKFWCVVGAGVCMLPSGADTLAAAQPQIQLTYRAVDLGVFPGDDISYAYNINSFEQIVGSSFDANFVHARAVMWANGRVTDLGTLPAPFNLGSEAFGINDFGQIVGNSYGVDDQGQTTSRAFLWQQGHMTDLGTLGGSYTAATAINLRGQIVGWGDTGKSCTIVFDDGSSFASDIRHAFIWENGRIRDLGTLNHTGECAYEGSLAADINNKGQIVGTTGDHSVALSQIGFMWQRGTMTALLGTAFDSQMEVLGINNFGQVLGIDDTASYANVLWSGGTIAKPLNCPGLGFAQDINDLGWVVGRNQNPLNNNFSSPTLCIRGLVTMLPPVGPQSGDNFPTRMNALGEIVGRGDLTEGTGFPDSRYLATHGVLWRPSLTFK